MASWRSAINDRGSQFMSKDCAASTLETVLSRATAADFKLWLKPGNRLPFGERLMNLHSH
jgi:hypothetical protein